MSIIKEINSLISNNKELIFSISFLISNLWLSSCLIFEDCEKIKLQKKNNKKCEVIFINFQKFEFFNISISTRTTKPT